VGKGYAPAIAGIWGREGGGVGGGLPKLKFSYVILPFKTFQEIVIHYRLPNYSISVV
jgi:hypothetical protein